MFYPVTVADMRQQLERLGASCVRPMSMQRRVNLDLPPARHSPSRWLRVREEGDTVTLALKEIVKNTEGIERQKELQIEVSDTETTLAILQELGASARSWQENRREIWRLGNVEVVIDEWPAISPLVELEGPDETSVQQAAEQLGFDWSSGIFATVSVIYEREHNLSQKDFASIKKLNFKDGLPKAPLFV